MNERAKTVRYASDDHADDLLADILDSTEDQARAEQAELDESMAARRAARERDAAEVHAARLAERQAKLERELERQATLAERRTQRMQALKVEDEPAPAEAPVVENTPSLDEAAIRRQIAEEVREELRVIGMTPMPAPVPAPRHTSRAGFIALAAGVLIATSAGIAAFAYESSYSPDPNPYAKAVFAPMDRDAVALEVSAIPIPKLDEVVPEPASKPVAKPRHVSAARSTPKEHHTSSVFDQPKGTTKARDSYERLKGMLDDSDDPFGLAE